MPGLRVTAPQGEDRSPVDVALDLLLHMPLGVLVTAREELPRLIAKGRQEAVGARFVGKMAVDLGQRKAGRLVRRGSERLADLGLVPDPRRARAGGPAPTPAGEGAREGAGEPDPAPPAAPRRSRAAAPSAGPARESLAIPGYDSLSAPQVVQRLDGLSADELEAVRAYETALRGRKTVLSRIAQIQSAG